MTTKQISVFLENKPGQLTEFTKVLQANGINMYALSLADAKDFGIIRVIVNDSYKAACVLKDEGYVYSITKVLAVEISDKPGSLVKVLNILGENGVNLEYTYVFTARKEGHAYSIIRVADNERAAEVLSKNGVKLICQDELAGLFGE